MSFDFDSWRPAAGRATEKQRQAALAPGRRPLVPSEGPASRALPALLERALVCEPSAATVAKLVRATFPEHRVAAVEFASTTRDAAFVIELNTALAIEEAPPAGPCEPAVPGSWTEGM
jgi:hypothetical protein